MTEKERTAVVNAAMTQNIDIRWADAPEAVKIQGVHLIEPSYQQLVDGLMVALRLNIKTVVIHSKLHKPG
jgi:hypothetical protein